MGRVQTMSRVHLVDKVHLVEFSQIFSYFSSFYSVKYNQWYTKQNFMGNEILIGRKICTIDDKMSDERTYMVDN